jgi:REP element-mobilizing transposase RayT
MMNNKRKHHRLTDWDYSLDGTYFITICCNERHPYLGTITKNTMVLSEIGSISSQYWLEIPDHFPYVRLDDFVIMPNHIHGILVLDNSLVGPRHGVALQQPISDIVGSCHGMTLPIRKESNQNINQFSKPVKNSVSVIINQYKSSVKRWCNKNGFEYFHWQSRFYDQILTMGKSIDNIREYIWNNPKNWNEDDLYNL